MNVVYDANRVFTLTTANTQLTFLNNASNESQTVEQHKRYIAAVVALYL